jgi:hypothetical protein
LVSDAAAGKIIYLDSKTPASLFQTTLPFTLHERVWHSADRSFAYLSSPQGWLVKFDMRSRQITQQLRVGQCSSGIALSADGRFIMAANLQPTSLVAIDANDFAIIRTIDVKDKAGKASGVSTIQTAAARKSFIAVMQDIPEIWELSYDEHAEPVYEGLVHDYKMAEAIALRGPFAPRSTLLERSFSSFSFDTNYTHAIGSSGDGLVQIINLNIRRKIRDLRFSSALQADAGATWLSQDRQMLALPQKDSNRLHLIDVLSWQVLQQMTLSGKNIRLHTHANAPYVWLESQPENDTKTKNVIQLLSKQTGAIIPAIPALITTSSRPLAWIDEGKIVVVQSKDNKALLLIDTTTLALLARLDFPDEKLTH